MKRIIYTALLLWGFIYYGQSQDTTYLNTGRSMALDDTRLSIRGYAQIDYNLPIEKGLKQNGKLEVHRMVAFLGYRFSDKAQFVTEIEIEHANEIYLEQAYLDYTLGRNISLRGGLLLIPMGIINEYHEPTLFNGVERPNVDKYIVPSTWREMGIGITGLMPNLNISYQAYLVNGFMSYDGEATLKGQEGLRGGRQKGIKAIMRTPNFSGKLDYFGVRDLKVGLSLYHGNTQSTLYDAIASNDESATTRADSSVLTTTMVGLDARYRIAGFELRGQFIHGWIGNTSAYNALTDNDMGTMLQGYYLEAAYNLLFGQKDNQAALLPFVRYEHYNTHLNTQELEANPNYNMTEITTGLTYRIGTSVSFKADYQFIYDDNGHNRGQLNTGIGIWF